MDQQGVVDVLLDDMGAILASTRANERPYLCHVRGHVDAHSPVGVLSRLYDPGVKWNLKPLLYRFYLIVFVVFVHRLLVLVNTLLSEGLLTLFLLVLQVLFYFVLLLSCGVFYFLFYSIVMLFKFTEFLITCVFNQESLWEDRKRVDAHRIVVLPHVYENSLFVC